MYLIEQSKQILREMLHYKTRSIMALFGIVWGTVAVVLLLSLGNGFYRENLRNMQGFADGTLVFSRGSTSMPYHGTLPGQTIKFKINDIIKLKTVVPGIKYLSPWMFNAVKVTRNNQMANADIQGVSADYATLKKIQLKTGGRFIDKLDIQHNRAVIFIGSELAQTLFPNNSNPIGKKVAIKGIPFTVIGLLKDLPNTGDWYNNTAIIPYTTFVSLFGNQDIWQFIVLAKNVKQSDALKHEVINYFSALYQFDPHDKAAINVFSMAQIYEFFNWFFRAIEIFLGFCGAMTLGVGGLCIANLMFLIVTERTNEIGLRMAIGATTQDIMRQIILETLIIVAVGGLIGATIALTTIISLQYIHLPNWLGTPTLSPIVCLATLLILAITALTAGYFPARRAANMQPVTALGF